MDVPFPVARNAAICGTYKRPISAACGDRARLLSGVDPELMYITGNKLAYFADVSGLILVIRKSMPRSMNHEFLFWAVTSLIQLIPHVERHEKIVCIAVDKHNRHLCLTHLLQR